VSLCFTTLPHIEISVSLSLFLCVCQKMNPHSLFASAAINIGLAFIVLSLFSILKKQPSTAPIYYARRLSQRHHIHFHRSLSFCRFLPSVSWIPRAFRVTEEEILETGGLDALVIIRLFKFGSVFFIYLLIYFYKVLPSIYVNSLSYYSLVSWFLLEYYGELLFTERLLIA
jgi:hypothetical protein